MGNKIIDFIYEKAKRSTDSKDVRPQDVLRMVAEDIEKGELDIDHLFIVGLKDPPIGNWVLARYRANLPRDLEVLLLDVCHRKALKEWLD